MIEGRGDDAKVTVMSWGGYYTIRWGDLWDAWRAMQSVSAWQRLQLTQAFVFAQPTREEYQAERSRLIAREHRLAFPPPEG